VNFKEIRWEVEDRLNVAQGKKKMAGLIEHGKEPSLSIKSWVFLEWLDDCYLFKED
jgi:hypothetical protein